MEEQKRKPNKQKLIWVRIGKTAYKVSRLAELMSVNPSALRMYLYRHSVRQGGYIPFNEETRTYEIISMTKLKGESK